MHDAARRADGKELKDLLYHAQVDISLNEDDDDDDIVVDDDVDVDVDGG